MTGPLDLDGIARMVNRPGATPAPWPAVAAVEQPTPTADDPIPSRIGPCSAPWLDVLPVAVDKALVDYQPPTLDDLGLTADPVAIVLRMRAQIDALVAGMTAEQRADLAQYEQPTRPNHLRSAA